MFDIKTIEEGPGVAGGVLISSFTPLVSVAFGDRRGLSDYRGSSSAILAHSLPVTFFSHCTPDFVRSGVSPTLYVLPKRLLSQLPGFSHGFYVPLKKYERGESPEVTRPARIFSQREHVGATICCANGRPNMFSLLIYKARAL